MTTAIDIAAMSMHERVQLISQLWDSIEQNPLLFTAAQLAELDQRMAGLAADEPFPWEVVHDEMITPNRHCERSVATQKS